MSSRCSRRSPAAQRLRRRDAQQWSRSWSRPHADPSRRTSTSSPRLTLGRPRATADFKSSSAPCDCSGRRGGSTNTALRRRNVGRGLTAPTTPGTHAQASVRVSSRSSPRCRLTLDRRSRGRPAAVGRRPAPTIPGPDHDTHGMATPAHQLSHHAGEPSTPRPRSDECPAPCCFAGAASNEVTSRLGPKSIWSSR